jgi:electron transport complex protein RnfG
MSETPATYQVQSASNAKMLRALVGLGVLCALLIVLTYEGTSERIAKNRAEALGKAIFQVLPGIGSRQSYTFDSERGFERIDQETGSGTIIYAGYDQEGNFAGVAIEASGQGYADVIRILYGYDPGKEAIVGFYVLESKETPGLGDKIEKDPAFLENFRELDVRLNAEGSALQNEVVPVKSGEKENPWEVDGITGATISSRAIANIIGSSAAQWVPLIYDKRTVFEQNRND